MVEFAIHKIAFDIRSPFGISSATIERTTEQWPVKVVIQLRLKGLENFKVSTEKIKHEASVSRSRKYAVRQIANLDVGRWS